MDNGPHFGEVIIVFAVIFYVIVMILKMMFGFTMDQFETFMAFATGICVLMGLAVVVVGAFVSVFTQGKGR